jgi:PAP2 superfamily
MDLVRRIRMLLYGGARHRTLTRATLIWLSLQLAIMVVGVVVYFGVRGLTAGDPQTAVENARGVVTAERWLGVHLPAATQEALITSDPLATVANWVYIWGHWPVIAATLLWLALAHRRHFYRLRNAMLISGFLGLFIYAFYPVAPPRLVGLGYVDTVAEQSNSYRVLQPPAFVNQYAAMPSLHVGWDLLVGLAVLGAAGTAWLRWVGRLMPVLMIVAVVVTANHYVLDVVGGVALGLVGLAGAMALERRRDAQGPAPGLRPGIAAPAALPRPPTVVPRPRTAPEAAGRPDPAGPRRG